MRARYYSKAPYNKAHAIGRVLGQKEAMRAGRTGWRPVACQILLLFVGLLCLPGLIPTPQRQLAGTTRREYPEWAVARYRYRYLRGHVALGSEEV